MFGCRVEGSKVRRIVAPIWHFVLLHPILLFFFLCPAPAPLFANGALVSNVSSLMNLAKDPLLHGTPVFMNQGFVHHFVFGMATRLMWEHCPSPESWKFLGVTRREFAER